MTTMEMPMDNSESNLNSQVTPVASPTNPTNQKTLIRKGKGVFSSTYLQPLSIVGLLIFVGLIIFMVKVMTPEPEIKTIDGGEVSTIKVDSENNGRDQLDVNQAKYLNEKQRIAAEKDAVDGVTTAAVLTQSEVNSAGTTYQVTDSTDLGAVTTDYQSIPKTYQQLKDENEASNKTLYTEGVDENGDVVFIDKKTGMSITPIDASRSASTRNTSTPVDTNATYASSSQDYNGGGSNNGGGNNGGGSNGANNGGGNNGGGSQANNGGGNDQNNQPRPPDPVIEAKRTQLSADFEAQQAQQALLDQQAAAAAQYRQERYQTLNDYRTKLANESLNSAIGSIQKSTGGKSSYAPLSYNTAARQNSSNQQGGAQQGNGQIQTYSQSLRDTNTTAPSSQMAVNNFQYGDPNFVGDDQIPSGNNNGISVGFGGQGSQQQNTQYNNAYSNQQNPQYNNAYSNQQSPQYNNAYSNQQNTMQGGQYNNGAYPSQQNTIQGGQYNGPYTPYANGVTTANNSQGLIQDNRLPANIIRAGTKWQVVITKSVNTDEGPQVIGELVTGKYAGSTVYGTVAQTGRSIGVQFTTIAPTNSRRPLVPIAAYATTIGGQKSAVATYKSNHYAQNYGIKTLTSILNGVGDAYENSGETSIVTDSGTVITTNDSEPSSKKIRANVLGELGDEITADIGKLGNRAPTFKVAIGTVLNVVLSSDLDVNGTTSTIAGNQ